MQAILFRLISIWFYEISYCIRVADLPLQWNLSVTTTSKIKCITCDLFSDVF